MRELRDRQIVDVLTRRPTCQQPSRDLLLPESLAEVAEVLRRAHSSTVRKVLSKRRQKLPSLYV
jgi:hypothetical protein